MEKYIDWVNEHITNPSLYISSIQDIREGHALFAIMQQITHTIVKTDTPLQTALQLAEKHFGKLEGLNIQKIEKGDEKQIIALIGFLMKKEKSTMRKLSDTVYKSGIMNQSSRRRAFTVKKDGKTVGVVRNEPIVSTIVENKESVQPKITARPIRHNVKPLNLKPIIQEETSEEKQKETETNVSQELIVPEPSQITKTEIPPTPTKELSPELLTSERKERREKKRQQIAKEKEKLRKMEESRKERTMKKEELKRMKEQMIIEHSNSPQKDVDTSLLTSPEPEIEKEETIEEVFRGVFMLEGNYYVVNEEGDGGELVEYVCEHYNEMVTSCARSLIVSYQYNKEIERQQEKMKALDARATKDHINSIIAIQTKIRCRNARHLPEIRGMKERKNLVKELIESEHKYVDNLKILKEYYLEKILEEREDKTIRNCFKNLEMIVKYNIILLKDLDDMSKKCVYGEGVSTVFKKFTGFLKCYTVYVNSYDTTNDYFVTLNSKNKRFMDLLKKLSLQKEVKNLNIFSYLILPIQRVPRYELFIRGVLKVLPRTHKEYKGLQDLMNEIKKIGDYLNERRRESENKQLLMKFKHHLEIKKFDLMDDDKRRLVKYGAIQSKEYGPLIIFLLSDVLLVHRAKQEVKDVDALLEKSKLKIKDIIPLFGIGIYSEGDNTFSVVSKKMLFTFIAENEEEKEDWMMAFDDILSREHNSAMSRLNTIRQSETVKSNKVDDIFYQGYLKMSLKMFEKYVGGIVLFNTNVDLTKKRLDGSPNIDKKNSPMQTPRKVATTQMLLSPRLNSSFRSPRSVRINNDHEEEKDRYCVIDGEELIVYNSVKDSLKKENWHMKVTLSGVSVEAVVAINNPAAFQINISGKTTFVTAPSSEDKWKWLTVFRDAFYRSAKDKLIELKILQPKQDIVFCYPPPPIFIAERGQFSNYLDMLLSIPTNSVCADCGDRKIVCADTTYGVFLCRDCSNCHKNQLKSTIVFIKNLYVKNSFYDIKIFKERGNLLMNELADMKSPDIVSKQNKADLLNSLSLRQEFLPLKYKDLPTYQ
ncbi:hypothetical protein ENUP19_0055G0108 [Entamoeba nuttalli]|uniref:Protein with RhoGEF and ArfGAP domains, putative n=2 Tax=Entamoeba nuttalli TaxID=412467 RepID=K2H3N4_ENTNP|nr:protein with RhoGEF and ArfGAP domains, putative [Entamoeba nuttalli P19]EKE37049.1 protein with RhoGEF and ArfGAP domains, putative [Entamoeba nuttalli P19]|eukprot:XP_008860615.1 protein with RhoGEF and ArfGAP domains, putative [Entamoeba nuttalli P19]